MKQFLNLGDASGATHKNDIMDLALVHLGVPKGFLHWLNGSTEQVCIELLETRPGDGGVEVCALIEGVNLNAGLGTARECALGTFACRTQTAHCSLVVGDFLLELALELCDEVVDHAIVKVLASQVGVTRCGLDLKDAVLYCQD